MIMSEKVNRLVNYMSFDMSNGQIVLEDEQEFVITDMDCQDLNIDGFQKKLLYLTCVLLMVSLVFLGFLI